MLGDESVEVQNRRKDMSRLFENVTFDQNLNGVKCMCQYLREEIFRQKQCAGYG